LSQLNHGKRDEQTIQLASGFIARYGALRGEDDEDDGCFRMNGDGRLELALTVSPRSVSTIRRFIESYVAEAAGRLGADSNLAARVALTIHELLENVALYGQYNHGTLCLAPTSSEGPRRLTITVTNTTTPEHIDRLQQALRETATAADPTAHYLMLMRREVGRDASGLGLARIRAEAEMELSLAIDRNEVRVSATSEIFGGEP